MFLDNKSTRTTRPFHCLSFVILNLAFVISSQAQWQSTTYDLKGGFNSIYLHGDASHDTLDNLLASGDAANIEQVWRWNPNPTQVQFTSDPLSPTQGTPEWSTWYRGNPGASTLSELTGQTAYLVKCTGTTANSYSVQIKHRPQPPSSVWVRNGANFLGFPTFKNGSSFPTMASYFATFPAAITANTRIYKYVGGDLGPSNPLQVFSPTFEKLDRNQAYWFDSEVVGSFYAPIEIAPTNIAGLVFGRTGSLIAVRLRNRTSSAVTMTITPSNSAVAPGGQTGITGPVPLTRRIFNSGTAQYEETAITAAFNEVIGPQSSIELEFGIERGAMSGNSSDFYASFLRFTDSGNQMEVFLPASAQPSSLAGLWIGDVQVTDVSRAVLKNAVASAVVTDGAVTDLSLIGSGGADYVSAPNVTIAAPRVGVTAEATAAVSGSAVSGLTVDAGGTTYFSPPAVTVAAPPPGSTATGTATLSGTVVDAITVVNGGGYYPVAPVVTIEDPPSGTTATAEATVTNGVVTGIVISNAGSGYTDGVPSVTVAPPPIVTATVTATVANGTLTGFTITDGGNGYVTPPVVTIAAPPPGTTAAATATLADGVVTGFTITQSGSGYDAAPEVIIAPPPVPPGSATLRSFPLRYLLHVDDAGTARLLSQVYTGKLATPPNDLGVCTVEDALKADEKESATRLGAAHMPLDLALTPTAGSVALGGTAQWLINMAFNDKVNPFVHRYHPDHDNKNARQEPIGNGVESHTVTRTVSFEFLASPPPGTKGIGWGATVLGGNYSETVTGIQKLPLSTSGTFTFRRVNDIGAITLAAP